jgi:hypothetical protein
MKLIPWRARWTTSAKAIILSATICLALGAGNVFAQEKPLIGAKAKGEALQGCWERADSSARYPTSLTYCFLAKGELQGWDIDNGHGVDFSGTWRKHKSNRIVIALKNTTSKTCGYDLDEYAGLLHLKDCTSSFMNGAFAKSKLNIK